MEYMQSRELRFDLSLTEQTDEDFVQRTAITDSSQEGKRERPS